MPHLPAQPPVDTDRKGCDTHKIYHFIPCPLCKHEAETARLAAERSSREMLRIIEWVDALRGELAEAEKQMDAHFKDQQYHYWEGVCDGIATALDRAPRIESASTDPAVRPASEDAR